MEEAKAGSREKGRVREIVHIIPCKRKRFEEEYPVWMLSRMNQRHLGGVLRVIRGD